MKETNTNELINQILHLKIPVMLMPVCNGNTEATTPPPQEGTEDDLYYIMDNGNKSKQPQNPVHEKYLIGYNTNVDADDKTGKLNGVVGFKSKHIFKKAINGCAATVSKGLMNQLMNDPDVLFIEKDTLMYENMYQKDPLKENPKALAYWHQTMTNTVQQVTDDYSKMHCYIVDTGILPTHTEFSTGQVVLAYNAITKNNRAQDDNGHGTAVASIVGGKMVGVANKTTLHAIKVLNSAGTGYVSDIVAGLNWIILNKKRPCVINMSLGGSFSTSINTAVGNCILNNIPVVCASGNSGIDASGISPANAPNVVTVSSHDETKVRPIWSNYGSVVETFAPGVGLPAAWGDSTTSYFSVSGTSFSAPLVSGIVCRYLKEMQTATPKQILTYVERSNILNEIQNVGSTTTPNQRLIWNTTKLNPC